MSRLDNLYHAEKNLRKEHEDVMNRLREGEKDVVKELILESESKLQELQRGLVIVVDYLPNQESNVYLSYSRDVIAEIADKMEVMFPVKQERNNRNAPKRISVEFPDGTVISKKFAADTMLATIRKIGVERVREVVIKHNLRWSGILVISTVKSPKREYAKKQKPLGGGLYLFTNSNTESKKFFLEKVSDVLHLGIKVNML